MRPHGSALLLLSGGVQAFVQPQSAGTVWQRSSTILCAQPSSVAAEVLSFLDAPSSLSLSDVLQFERQGHCLTKSLFTADEMAALAPHIRSGFQHFERTALKQKVDVLLGEDTANDETTATELRALLSQVPSEQIPFLQLFNMWRTPGSHQQTVKKLALSARLASVAAALLGCNTVRLYQVHERVAICLNARSKYTKLRLFVAFMLTGLDICEEARRWANELAQ